MISRHCGYTLDIILSNLLALVKAGQGSSKHVHSVVDQSSLRLEYVSFGKDHNNKATVKTFCSLHSEKSQMLIGQNESGMVDEHRTT